MPLVTCLLLMGVQSQAVQKMVLKTCECLDVGVWGRIAQRGKAIELCSMVVMVVIQPQREMAKRFIQNLYHHLRLHCNIKAELPFKIWFTTVFIDEIAAKTEFLTMIFNTVSYSL